MGNSLPLRTSWWHQLRPHTGRGISSVSAIAAAIGLLWFMVIRADWIPSSEPLRSGSGCESY